MKRQREGVVTALDNVVAVDDRVFERGAATTLWQAAALGLVDRVRDLMWNGY
jgi:hypothetical protein